MGKQDLSQLCRGLPAATQPRRATPSFQVLWDLWQDLGWSLTEWTFVGPLAFSHLFPLAPPGFSSLRVPLTLSPGRHGLELGSSGLSVRPVASPRLQLTPPFRVSLVTLELWTWVWNCFQYSISVTVGFFRFFFGGGVGEEQGFI